MKRPETVVTNEKEAARMIKLVRPRWKRSDLVLQVSFWCYPVESALSILTISYQQRISPLYSNHCWVAYNLDNCEERLLIQTLPRFFLPNLDHHNVCLLTSRDSVEKVSQVQSLLENQGLAPALEATFANGLVITMRVVITIVIITITIGR